MSVPENGVGSSPYNEWWKFPRQIYIKCSSDLVPCAEAMGYTMGKTLGSGTYAKVKAAWSPFEGRMVSYNKGVGLAQINTHIHNWILTDCCEELEQEAGIRGLLDQIPSS